MYEGINPLKYIGKGGKMNKKTVLSYWLHITLVVLTVVFFLFCFNRVFSRFWFDGTDNINTVKKQFKNLGPKVIFARDKEGRTALHIASNSGNLKVAKFLVEKGADVNARVKKFQKLDDKNMPLHLACYKNNIGVAKFLVKNDANIMAYNTDLEGSTPLHFTVYTQTAKDFEDIVTTFVENGANINICDKRKGVSPLFWAIDNNKIEFVKVLIEKFGHLVDLAMKVNSPLLKDNSGKPITNVFEFSEYKFQSGSVLNYMRSVKPKKLDGTADFNALDKYGFTIPMYAALKGRKEIFDLIPNRPGTNLNIKDKTKMGNTALHWACLYNKPESVVRLVNLGARVTIKNNLGAEPIFYVDRILGSKKRKEVINLLLQKGAKINTPDNRGNNLMHRVVTLADHEVATDLVKNFEKSVNFDAKNKKGQTPLDLAKKRKDPFLINLLKPFYRRTQK